MLCLFRQVMAELTCLQLRLERTSSGGRTAMTTFVVGERLASGLAPEAGRVLTDIATAAMHSWATRDVLWVQSSTEGGLTTLTDRLKHGRNPCRVPTSNRDVVCRWLERRLPPARGLVVLVGGRPRIFRMRMGRWWRQYLCRVAGHGELTLPAMMNWTGGWIGRLARSVMTAACGLPIHDMLRALLEICTQ
jgi:hypothetical protein